MDHPDWTSERGFSLLELLIGFTVLAVAMAGIGIFFKGQAKGLMKSNLLSCGTQIALSRLEQYKGLFADPARFQSDYLAAEHGSILTDTAISAYNRNFGVVTYLDRAPAPLHGLRVRARVSWEGGHALEIGVLVPGPSPTL